MSQTEVQLIKADAVVTADIANSAVTDAKISALTSSKLSGALPAISGASLTNLPASGKAHNLIINGAMKVAQRGTSETGVSANGFSTVDRFAMYQSGTDGYPSTAQADVASGTTPYTSGFRKSFKITNGNQTSGGQAADQLYISHKIEAQDMATSGWNYTSASSNVTLSFWVKSSVAQNFYAYLKVNDGTTQNYPFETGSLTANTWTKITKTIPGNSNLQFDTDTEANRVSAGIEFAIGLFFGTDHTGTITLNQWGAWSSTNRLPDYGTANDDWYETNGATFELTGVQLEVGDSATDFEHRSFGQDLALCQRYYYNPLNGASNDPIASGTMSYHPRAILHFPVTMRAAPSIVANSQNNNFYYHAGSTADFFDTMTLVNSSPSAVRIQASGSVSNPSDGVGLLMMAESTSAVLGFNAEL